jgi:transcriptional regulator GlxA family with amidase domain
MKNVAILVAESAVIEAVADPRYMFTAVNDFLRAQGKDPAFRIQMIGLRDQVKLADGMFTIQVDATPDKAIKPDLIIIPALSGDLEQAIELNEDFIPWIVFQHRMGAEVASLCLGAFLLGATGLVDGKSCSTHWQFANQFRHMFPSVNLVDDRVITEQAGIYTSGGANSYWNLLLHLVEKYTGRDMAIAAAKFFVLDIDKKSQSPFMVFKGQKLHEDKAVIRAQEYIEDNYTERIGIEDLCRMLGVGRRTFERRFRRATHNSVVEYIQRVKIEAAKRELESGQKSVSEVMYEVGYSDTKAFRDVFRKVTSVSPVEYRKKFVDSLIC